MTLEEQDRLGFKTGEKIRLRRLLNELNSTISGLGTTSPTVAENIPVIEPNFHPLNCEAVGKNSEAGTSKFPLPCDSSGVNIRQSTTLSVVEKSNDDKVNKLNAFYLCVFQFRYCEDLQNPFQLIIYFYLGDV